MSRDVIIDRDRSLDISLLLGYADCQDLICGRQRHEHSLAAERAEPSSVGVVPDGYVVYRLRGEPL
jgi:hypothetical protein